MFQPSLSHFDEFPIPVAPAEGVDPVAYYRQVVAVIRGQLLDPRFSACAIAWSAGKDSTLVLCLALEAARQLREKGRALRPLLVLSANTGVENPLMVSLAEREFVKIRAYAARHDLPVDILVGRPTVAQSWAVSIIAGLALPPAPGGKAWCSNDWKIQPLRSALSSWQRQHGIAGKVLKLTGTRFAESQARSRAMEQRGESATEVFFNRTGEPVLSPIAEADDDLVWELLGLIKAGALPGYSDLEALFEVYRQAGGSSCVIVADDRLRGQGGGCGGSRTGCWACTKVSEDASMASISAERPALRPLHRLREFIAAIAFDYKQRYHVGRTIQPGGFVRLAPDSFSPALCEQLLGICLSIDADERARAEAAGEPPLFEIIDLETLICIDFYWSAYGSARPFQAWRILRAVESGARIPIPEVQPVPRSPVPPARYLYVGTEDWRNAPGSAWSGLCDPLYEALEADTPGEYPLGSLPDGRVIIDYERAPQVSVNLESQDTWDWFQFMLDDAIADADRCRSLPIVAVHAYLRAGVIRYPNLPLLAAMVRRAACMQAQGHGRSADLESLLARSISEAEYREWVGEGAVSRQDAARAGSAQQLVLEI